METRTSSAVRTGAATVEASASKRRPGRWKEVYLGGSLSREEDVTRRLAADITRVQAGIRKREKAPVIRRAFHAKTLAGLSNAIFRVMPSLPEGLSVGFIQPGGEYPATVRFSNASGACQPDTKKDMRGIAVRVQVDRGEVHDLLLTNAPASHARDARQFMVAALAFSSQSTVMALPKLLLGLGVGETVRMLRVLNRDTHPVRSMATEQFWSRAPYAFGDDAVKFTLKPRAAGRGGSATGGQDLRADLVERLRNGPVVFDLLVQRYVDDARTPIEDASVEWKESDSPFEAVAELVIPAQDLTAAGAMEAERAIERLDFNPWHTTDEFRPLGSLNRARRRVYDSSVHYRDQKFPQKPKGLPGKLWEWSQQTFFTFLNRMRPWYRLPLWLAVLNLSTLRRIERAKNLYDTANPTSTVPQPCPTEWLTARESEGRFTDPRHPQMGSAGQRFGRNVPRELTYPEPEPGILDPSPRVISRRLMARDSFVPATTLNLLAAAWIQFQVHDWLAHEKPQPGDEWKVPLDEGDDWPTCPMRIRRTPADLTRSPAEAGLPPTYTNRESHWWDASQIYGDDPETTRLLRSQGNGKLEMDERKHLLPIDPITHTERTGFTDNWWVGLALMHTLFSREHNAIVDMLRNENPYWTSDQLFDTARLINTGLMAKIHTVDWTTAILSNPVLQVAMRANWWGLETETGQKVFGRILHDNEEISGIPGSQFDHQGIPYSLTEEFTAVYRMHPLIPDSIRFFNVTEGTLIKQLDMKDVAFEGAHKILDDGTTMADVIYSFGITHPGAIQLHNYPSFLRNLELPDGQLLDMAAVDVMRDRERGVPRYNTFRKMLHLPRVKSFDELTANPTWAAELRDIYHDDIDRVDLLVGMLAETPPPGFGFSDTAFRIFILTASRRIKSDRFLTEDYSPAVYTQAGLDWIENNGMASVLIRHYPELKAALRGVDNPFAPWRTVA
jgi:hypothetical protein